jgi:hypothetical protein
MADVQLGDLIGRMSPSRIDCANRCLAQFYFRYVERSQFVGGSVAINFGNAFDATTGDTYTEKLKTENVTTPSASDVADRWAAAWDYNAELVDDWGDNTRGDMLDRGVKGVQLWRDNIAQYVAPLEAPQVRLSATVKDPLKGDTFELMGFADLHAIVRDRDTITDMKAPGKLYTPDRLLTETQPVAYTLMAGVSRFEYHVMTSAKNPKVQVIGADISKDAQDAFLIRTGMLRRQVKHAWQSGDWLPNRQHMMCKRRFCDDWQKCEAKFGGKVVA